MNAEEVAKVPRSRGALPMFFIRPGERQSGIMKMGWQARCSMTPFARF
jgi:hypothetical protein